MLAELMPFKGHLSFVLWYIFLHGNTLFLHRSGARNHALKCINKRGNISFVLKKIFFSKFEKMAIGLSAFTNHSLWLLSYMRLTDFTKEVSKVAVHTHAITCTCGKPCDSSFTNKKATPTEFFRECHT